MEWHGGMDKFNGNKDILEQVESIKMEDVKDAWISKILYMLYRKIIS